MEYFIKRFLRIISLLILIFLVSGCNDNRIKKSESTSLHSFDFSAIDFSVPTEVSYAEHFSIEKSKGCALLKINGEKPVLVLEKDFPLPCGVPSDYTVLRKPLDKVYLVSSSVMDFFIKLNILDFIRFSGIKKENCYLQEALEAMENGKLIYAGKYSAPDYELLYSERTSLSIQNTMIYHKPEVKEKLEQLNIPVIVEKSSYEKNPLGKLEWIKLYGFLFDKENEAADFFNSKIEEYNAIKNMSGKEKTAAVFFITSSNTVNIRKPGDYIVKSIEMAGGKYFLDASVLEEDNAFSSMTMEAESFYAKAKDSDILIYNSTIDGMIDDEKVLLHKYPLIKDFKGYRNHRVYCTDRKFFQETTGIVDFMQDLKKVFNDEETELHYLVKIK